MPVEGLEGGGVDGGISFRCVSSSGSRSRCTACYIALAWKEKQTFMKCSQPREAAKPWTTK
eukprot:scaffold35011_cov57-Phaeocystis_antarctica.AAC.1